MITVYDKPKIRIMGDRAILVEAGDDIAPDINESVQVLLYGLSARGIAGITDLVPGYRSLMVSFDPLVLGRKELHAIVEDVWNNRKHIGKHVNVLVEEEAQENLFSCRTFFQAPDVDGLTYIRSGSLAVGSFVVVKITDAFEYDLIGDVDE